MTDVIVLGAGMIGVSTAIALQGRGHDVVLVDRKEAGRETSHGNAGIIQAEAVEPYALPSDPRYLLSILTGRTNDVAYRAADIRNWVGPVLRYAVHSWSPHYRNRIIPRWAEMVGSAIADHAPLIEAAGAGGLIDCRGFRQAYRNGDALQAAVDEAEGLRVRFGVPFAALDGGELAVAEPGLRVPMAGAIHWTGSWSCSDPGELVRLYAELFRRRGGTILHGEALSLRMQGEGWAVEAEGGAVRAGRAVVCLGPWSPGLLRRFGYRFSMVPKRGYHRHVAVQQGPRLPMMDVASGTMLSPMRLGLRVLTGAELARPDLPGGTRQIERSIRAAREMFAASEPLDAMPWMGTRPCMSDMLPVVGPSGRHKGLWFNFGHGHQGFTLGPTTARILAERFG